MSTSIDNRVVEMSFDNKDFEKGISQSLKSLQAFENEVNSGKIEKGFSLDGVMHSIMRTTRLFDPLMGAGLRALTRIADQAVQTGMTMVKALTLDPIKTGFQEYETQINAIQTILANTSSKGTTLDQVNEALDELNHYADMTIYNFTEMTRNIGTFTAAGVDLDTSVQAIKGIANLAAISGSNSEQASRAMYQLSQALSSGTVKLQDWNSVVNAGMGGQVFQDALKETARIHGINIDAMIKREGSFRETLKDGWLTSAILTETLAKFTGDLNEEQLKSMGYTEQQIKDIIELGKTANDAATKVKTFTQLFDTLKEAAQSGWTQSWEILIGDFEEAKTLLTAISDIVGGIINNMSEKRNTFLTEFVELGGRTSIINTVANALQALWEVLKLVKESFQNVFPPVTAKRLAKIAKVIELVTKKLILSDNYLREKLEKTLTGIFAILGLITEALERVGIATIKFIDWVSPGIDIFLTFTAAIGDFFRILQNSVNKIGFVRTFFTESWRLAEYARIAFENFKIMLDKTFENNPRAKEWFENITIAIQKFIDFIRPAATVVAGACLVIKEALVALADKINTIVIKPISINPIDISGLQRLELGTKLLTIFHAALTKIKERYEEFSETIRSVDLVTMIKNVFNTLAEIMLAFINSMKPVLQEIGLIWLLFEDLMIIHNYNLIVSSLSGLISGAKNVVVNFGTLLKTINTAITGEAMKRASAGLLSLAVVIMAISLSVILLSQLDWHSLNTWVAMATTLGSLALMMGTLAAIANINARKLEGAGSALLGMAAGIAIMVWVFKSIYNSLYNLKEFDMPTLATTIVAFAGLIAVMAIAARIMSSNKEHFIQGGLSLLLFALAVGMLVKPFIQMIESLNTIKAGAKEYIAGISAFVGMIIALGLAANMMASGAQKFWATLALIGVLTAFGKTVQKLVATLGEMDESKLSSVTGVMWSLTAFIGVIGLVIGGIAKLTQSTLSADINGLKSLLLAMSLFVGVIGAMVYALGFNDVSENVKNAGVLIGMVAAMGGLMLALNKIRKDALIANNLQEISNAILIVSGSLVAISGALYIMSKVPTASNLGNVTVLILGLAGIWAALRFLTNGGVDTTKLQGAAVGLVIASASLVVMALALNMIADIDWNKSKGTILSMIGAFVILLGFVYLMRDSFSVNILTAAAGMVLMAASLIEIAIAVGILAEVMKRAGDDKAVIASIVALAAALIGLSVVAGGLGKVAPEVILAAAAIFLLGAAVLAVGAGVLAFAAAVEKLANTFVLIAQNAELLFTTAPRVAAAFVLMFTETVAQLAAKLPEILTSISQILDAILELIVMYIPKLVAIELKAITETLKALRTYAPVILQLTIELLQEIGRVISESGIVENAVGNLGKKILSIALSFINPFPQIGTLMIEGLATGLTDRAPLVSNVLHLLSSGMIGIVTKLLGINSPSKVFAWIGENCCYGLVDGTTSATPDVLKTMKALGVGLLTTLCNILGIASPSTETDEVGQNTALGLINGVTKLLPNVNNVGALMGNTLLEGLKSALPSFMKVEDDGIKINTDFEKEGYKKQKTNDPNKTIDGMYVKYRNSTDIKLADDSLASEGYVYVIDPDDPDGFRMLVPYKEAVEKYGYNGVKTSIKYAPGIKANAEAKARREAEGEDFLDHLLKSLSDNTDAEGFMQKVMDELGIEAPELDIEGIIDTSGIEMPDFSGVEAQTADIQNAVKNLGDSSAISTASLGDFDTSAITAGNALDELDTSALETSYNFDELNKSIENFTGSDYLKNFSSDMESIGEQANTLKDTTTDAAQTISASTTDNFINMRRGYDIWNKAHKNDGYSNVRYTKEAFDEFSQRLFHEFADDENMQKFLSELSPEGWAQMFDTYNRKNQGNLNTKSAVAYVDSTIEDMKQLAEMNAEYEREKAENTQETIDDVTVDLSKYDKIVDEFMKDGKGLTIISDDASIRHENLHAQRTVFGRSGIWSDTLGDNASRMMSKSSNLFGNAKSLVGADLGFNGETENCVAKAFSMGRNLTSSQLASEISQKTADTVTAKHQTQTDYTNNLKAIESSVDRLSGEVTEIQNDIKNLKVVLDSGAIVGELASPLDKWLGKKAASTARGV